MFSRTVITMVLVMIDVGVISRRVTGGRRRRRRSGPCYHVFRRRPVLDVSARIQFGVMLAVLQYFGEFVGRYDVRSPTLPSM